MISPAGKEEEEGMQYALASFFFFLPPYAEKDEHGNQSGANNKQQKEPLKKDPIYKSFPLQQKPEMMAAAKTEPAAEWTMSDSAKTAPSLQGRRGRSGC